MAPHRLLLLGTPTWQTPAARTVVLPGQKPAALLWYVASQPDKILTRAHLADLFWEYQLETEARANLSKSLSRLRAVLPVWPLHLTRDTISWQSEGAVTTDLAAFRHSMAAETTAAWAHAVSLWRGPFLEGATVRDCPAFELWLLDQRQHLEQRLLLALGNLTAAAASAGDWSAVAAHARRALVHDPLLDPFQRWLMLALAAQENRPGALAQFQRYANGLQAEMGTEPDPTTIALRQAIAAGEPLARWLPEAAAEPWSITPNPAAPPLFQPPADLPLAGRERELDTIMHVIRGDTPTLARRVFLCGEAGIGKTRLVQEAALQWQAAGGQVLVGECFAETAPMPYAPWQTMWRQRPPQLQAQRPLTNDGPLDFDALLTALPTPTLLVLEDIHWADPISLQLLADLLRRPDPRHPAVLITGRTGDLSPATDRLLRQLEREHRLLRLEVGPLSEDAVSALADAILHGPNPALAQQLYRRSAGNPLFAIELARAWRETDGHQEIAMVARALAAVGPRAAADIRAGGRDPAAAIRQIPAAIDAVIGTRLATLSTAARDFCTTTAVFPQAVPFTTVQAVVGLSEAESLRALEELRTRGVLQETATGIAFNHDLVRDAVRANTSQARQELLHQRAYHALAAAMDPAGGPAAAPAPQTLPELLGLAYHAMGGGLWPVALQCNLAGVTAARQLFYLPAAGQFLQQALICLTHMTPTAAVKAQTMAVGLELTFALLLHQGPAVAPKRLAAIAGDPAAWGPALAVLQAADAAGAGHFAAAYNAIEQAVGALPADGPPTLRAAAQRARAAALGQIGQLPEALAALNQAAVQDQQLGRHFEAGLNRLILATLMGHQGDFEAAMDLLEQMHTALQADSDLAATGAVLAIMAVVATIRGDWPQVQRLSQAATTQAAQLHLPHLNLLGRLCFGPALLAAGDIDAALTTQRETAALALELNDGGWYAHARIWQAEIELAAGQRTEAAVTAQAIGADAAISGDQIAAAESARLQGAIAATQGDVAAARPWLERALALAIAVNARPLTAHCHAALAALPDSHDRNTHYEQARRLFTELGMDWYLARLVS